MKLWLVYREHAYYGDDSKTLYLGIFDGRTVDEVKEKVRATDDRSLGKRETSRYVDEHVIVPLNQMAEVASISTRFS